MLVSYSSRPRDAWDSQALFLGDLRLCPVNIDASLSLTQRSDHVYLQDMVGAMEEELRYYADEIGIGPLLERRGEEGKRAERSPVCCVATSEECLDGFKDKNRRFNR